MARKPNTQPRAIGAGVAALQATLQASLAALDNRTVTHAAAFQALDLIDQALSDVAATAAVLDEITANMGDDTDAKADAIDTVFRHLQADLATLQRANAEARAAILRPRALA